MMVMGALKIDTKQIGKEIITIDEKPIKKGMPIAELEQVIGRKIEATYNDTWYLTSQFKEDNNTVLLFIKCKDELIDGFHFRIGSFVEYDEAAACQDRWLSQRKLTKCMVKDRFYNYFKTEFGLAIASIGQLKEGKNIYTYVNEIELSYN